MFAVLIGQAGVPLDAPRTHALMERIIAGEMAVFDETIELVATAICELFVLAHVGVIRGLCDCVIQLLGLQTSEQIQPTR